MNLAIFDGWICTEDDKPYDDEEAPAKLAIAPDAVALATQIDDESDEDPKTILILKGYHTEWYVVKGTLQNIVDTLKIAGKKF